MTNLSLTFIKVVAGLATVTSLASQAIDLRIDNVRLYQAEQSTFSQSSTLYIEDGKIIKITASENE